MAGFAEHQGRWVRRGDSIILVDAAIDPGQASMRARQTASTFDSELNELSMTYRAPKKNVSNRDAPPDSFLDELVVWGKIAPDDIFAPNRNDDVYSSVSRVLGPYKSLCHRRAVMLEVMRVLAGFESGWTWNQGRDRDADARAARHNKVRSEVELEAGAWQVSANSMRFGQELKDLVLAKVGSLDGNDFQRAMKQDHKLAMEYIARLLRRTVTHNGPVKRHEIDPWLRRDAVAEFESLLGV